MSDTRAAICANASNEAYFLPQWIYHHKYFGFNDFHISINNTQDNSLAILEKLQTYFQNIHIYNTDWVGKYFVNRIPRDFIVEAINTNIYYNLGGKADYILFIDSDEYWTPLNCQDSIQTCLQRFAYPDLIVFQWLFVGGHTEYLSPLLSCKNFFGILNPLTKYIIKTEISPDKLGVHVPCALRIRRCLTGAGLTHKYNKRNCTHIHPEQSCLADYFILHDAINYPARNFAKYAIGHPLMKEGTSTVEKMALRPMFFQMSSAEHPVHFRNQISEGYLRGYRQMIRELDLYDDLFEAKKFHYLYALSFLRQIYHAPSSSLHKIFVGQIGTIEATHHELLTQLAALDAAYSGLEAVALASPETLLKPEPNLTMENFKLAIRLYPLEKDLDNAPLFLKKFVEYLTANANIELAYEVLNDKTLLTNRCFDSGWSLSILAATLEKLGRYEEALNIYRRMVYAGDRSVSDAVERAEKLLGAR